MTEGRQAVTAGEARRIAARWVDANAAQLTGFVGAYSVGSINELADDAPVPATSDVDVMVVIDVPDVPAKAGKMRIEGVLLEITWLAWDDVRDSERVLLHYHLAAGMAGARILANRAGRLGEVVRAVREGYAEPEWIGRRCRMAEQVVCDRLDGIRLDAPAHERAMSWLFATGGVPHVLLVAGLWNPTVRRRYEAALDLLGEYGLEDADPGLLALAGLDGLTPEDVATHLGRLGGLFDAAARLRRSPVMFASDISPEARPLVFGGSREMIGRGRHREAMFWVAVTFTRCMQILHADAPEVAARWEDAFSAMLDDLGVLDPAGMARSAERIRETLPEVTALAGTLLQSTACHHPASRSQCLKGR